MRLRKPLSLLLAGVMTASALSACAGGITAQEDDGRVSISMYMWDRSMFNELSP